MPGREKNVLAGGFPPEFAERYRREGYWRGEVLGDLLREWAARDPHRVALVAPGGRWTYRELDERADRVAAGLAGLGIRPGDRVVVQLPNGPDFPVVSVALFRLGALPVYALPSHRRAEIGYLCQHAEAVAFITSDVRQGFDYRLMARQVRDDVPGLRHVVVAGQPGGFLPLAELETAPARDLPAPRPDLVAFFLLSGGTTGMPKLIPRTHDDYAYQLRATAEGLGVDEHGVYLAALPVAHNAALGCPGLLGTLRAGGKVVMSASPSPDEAFDWIEAEGVTLTTLMPPLVLLWLEAAPYAGIDFSGLTIQVGSARFAPELATRVLHELGARLTHWFGMAEGLLTYTRMDDPESVIVHTQGRPLAAADELRVVDENGEEVPPGQTGELLTRGPYTLRGYYRAQEHNARAFTADGFLRTGDLVRLTPDGNMIVEGRLKDVINRGGEKISAGEIEDHLIAHPAVREVAAVAMPDEILGEKVCVFVVPAGTPPSLAAVQALLRDRGLAAYKLPERLEVVADLPRTKVGKVDKGTLRATLAAAATTADGAAGQPSPHERAS
jgi:2,3-dihydroxybenzoate-AMP ligase